MTPLNFVCKPEYSFAGCLAAILSIEPRVLPDDLTISGNINYVALQNFLKEYSLQFIELQFNPALPVQHVGDDWVGHGMAEALG